MKKFSPEKSWSKHQVALSSVFAAIFLTLIKAVVGIFTNSLGLLSEAAHSGLDTVAAIITFFAVKVSGKPADQKHTYGHGKIESLSALFETILLMVTCFWIIYEAIERLFFREVLVQPSVWGFVVIGISIVIDLGRSRALKKAAIEFRSQALEADALHFSTDIWSSLVVLFGLGMVFLSTHLNLPRLVKADAFAALIVAGIVIWISLRLGKRTIDDLLDSVPSGLVEQIQQRAQVPGVGEVKRVRLRRSGPIFFADLTLSVRSDFPLAYAHQIAHQAEEEVQNLLPEADIVVHVDPQGQDHENTVIRIREIAAQHDLSPHAIAVLSKEGKGSMEMHLEVDGELSVREAHDRVSGFEKEIQKSLPTFSTITTHIEPSSIDLRKEESPEPLDEKKIQKKLKQISEDSDVPFSVHDLQIWREEGKLVVVFHCDVDGSINVGRAHLLTENIERRLRESLPNLDRVLIHIEPQNETDKTN